MWSSRSDNFCKQPPSFWFPSFLNWALAMPCVVSNVTWQIKAIATDFFCYLGELTWCVSWRALVLSKTSGQSSPFFPSYKISLYSRSINQEIDNNEQDKTKSHSLHFFFKFRKLHILYTSPLIPHNLFVAFSVSWDTTHLFFFVLRNYGFAWRKLTKKLLNTSRWQHR